jgi:WD40 repeat protein
MSGACFDPSGQWVVVGGHNDLAFWPLTHPQPYVLNSAGKAACALLSFTPDGRSLTGLFGDGNVKSWDLVGGPIRTYTTPTYATASLQELAMDPGGKVLVVTDLGGAVVIPLGSQPRKLPNGGRRSDFAPVAISPDARFAAATMWGPGDDTAIRLWDLETDTIQFLERSQGGAYGALAFTPDGNLISGGMDGTVKLWNLRGGTDTTLATGRPWMVYQVAVTGDGRRLVVLRVSERTTESGTWTSELTCYDLVSHRPRTITTHGNRVSSFALDQAGTLLATIGSDGLYRVGPITGEEPHLLPPSIASGPFAISPDGKWFAAGDGGTSKVYLWRVTQGKPFHSLPHKEFLERARDLTYLRVVPDATTPNGYRVDPVPFTGWETAPTW